MLFDHGVDAYVVSFVVLLTAKLIGAGNSGLALILISGCTSMFYFAVLEEYYVGGMVFAHCNAITDGSIMSYIFYIYMAIVGNGFWRAEIIPADFIEKDSASWNFLQCFFIFCFIVNFGNCIIGVIKCFTQEKFEGKGRVAHLPTILLEIFIFTLMVTGTCSLAYVGEKPLISQIDTVNGSQSWGAFWVLIL